VTYDDLVLAIEQRWQRPIDVVVVARVVAAYREQMRERGVVEIHSDDLRELVYGYGGFKDQPAWLRAKELLNNG
jgi:hypothetical protein